MSIPDNHIWPEGFNPVWPKAEQEPPAGPSPKEAFVAALARRFEANLDSIARLAGVLFPDCVATDGAKIAYMFLLAKLDPCEVADPGRSLQQAFLDAEEAGRPYSDNRKEDMSLEALRMLPAWRGHKAMPRLDLLASIVAELPDGVLERYGSKK